MNKMKTYVFIYWHIHKHFFFMKNIQDTFDQRDKEIFTFDYIYFFCSV